MPRHAGMDTPGALHHIIARGLERREIFRDAGDSDDFLRRSGKIARESQTRCYARGLIPDHFHLLLKTGNVPVATVMRRLPSGYAGDFNRRHHRAVCFKTDSNPFFAGKMPIRRNRYATST